MRKWFWWLKGEAKFSKNLSIIYWLYNKYFIICNNNWFMNETDSTWLRWWEHTPHIVDGSHEVFDWLALARELGVENPRFPEEQYRAVENILTQFLEDVVPNVIDMSDQETVQYLYEHLEELFDIFDPFEFSWRIPLLMSDSFVVNLIESISADWRDWQKIMKKVGFCINFMLFSNRISHQVTISKRTAGLKPTERVREIMWSHMQSEWWSRHAAIFQPWNGLLTEDALDVLRLRIIAHHPETQPLIPAYIQYYTDQRPRWKVSIISDIMDVLVMEIFTLLPSRSLVDPDDLIVKIKDAMHRITERMRNSIPAEFHHILAESLTDEAIPWLVMQAVREIERTIIDIAESFDIWTAERNKFLSAVMKVYLGDELPVERILIHAAPGPFVVLRKGGVLSLPKGRFTPDVLHQIREHESKALSFILCQNNINGYDDLIPQFAVSDFIPTWCVWIEKNIQLLMRNSQASIIFRRVFGIEGDILCQEDDTWVLGGAEIPPEIWAALLSAANKRTRQPAQPKKRVLPGRDAPALVARVLATSTPLPEPEPLAPLWIVPIWEEPNIDHIFPDFETSQRQKKELETVDLTNLQEMSVKSVVLRRSSAHRKKTFTDEFIVTEHVWSRFQIPPLPWEYIRWRVEYEVVITLNDGHIFAINNQVKLAVRGWYYMEKWTPPVAPTTKTLISEVRAAPHAFQVQDRVANILQPELTFAQERRENDQLILDWAEEDVLLQHARIDEVWIVTIDLSKLPDATGLKPHSGIITVSPDNAIIPWDLWVDVDVKLVKVTEKKRKEAWEKIKHEKEQAELRAQQEREQHEYEGARTAFGPLLNFARDFQFEGREIGDIKQQRERLRWELAPYWWSIPTKMAVGAQWRHTEANIIIKYRTVSCDDYTVVCENWDILTRTQQRCYEEVAESCAHIARFFTAEIKERKALVRREIMLNREKESKVESYEKLLQLWQARLVKYWRHDRKHLSWWSKFPEGNTPTMLTDRAGYEERKTEEGVVICRNVDDLLATNPGAELCYRRDVLRFNGEIPKDASDASEENTMMNLVELRNSPRARYILRKRILITLQLETFTGDEDRSRIKEENKKWDWWVSALSLLLGLNKIRTPRSSEDVDDVFLDEYIDSLVEHKIRIQYVWPLSVTLENHRKRVAKLPK